MKATDALLDDHKMIRKILDGFQLDNPRFSEILKTLHRVVRGHAWFEDTIFLPAVKAEPLFARRFTDELFQEHKDIDHLLESLGKIRENQKRELEATALQFRAILETHFKKEEDALFPLAEKILNEEGLNK